MRLARSTAGVFGTNLLNLVLSFGNSILLTRTLGVVGRGEFAIFSASFGILSLLLGLGLDLALRYFVAREKVARDRILTSLVAFVLLAGALLAAGVHLNHRMFRNEIFLPYARQTLAMELTLVGVVMANLFHGNIASVFAGARSFKTLNVATIVFATVSLAAYAVLFAAQQRGFWAVGVDEVFLAYLTLTLFNAAVLGGLAYWKLGVRPSWRLLDRDVLRTMLRYATVAFAANVAQFLNYRVDIWIVQYFEGSAPLGLYSLAANLAMMLWILPRSMATVLLPAMADGGASFEEAARMARMGLVATAIVGLPLALSAPTWIGLLYGGDFTGAGLPFAILLVGCIPFTLCVVQAGALAGANRPDVNLLASGAGLAVTVALDILLIPRWGIAGAAAASAGSYFVTTAVVVFFYSRIAEIPVWSCVLPRAEDVSELTHGLKNLLR
jgi:O-antigen/teichoic acid export membrane protein